MKVLMISKALVGGVYHKKLEELALLGIDLHVVVPYAWGNQPLEISKPETYKLYPMPIYCSGKNHFHIYRGLSPLLKHVRPDIVHIDEEHYSLVTFQTMRIVKQIRAKSLFFTWQNIYKKYPFPFSYIEQYNFRQADMAIAGNEEAKDVLKEKGFHKDISVIPQFAVDAEIFRRTDCRDLKKKLGLDETVPVIGYVGRFVKEKGIDNLIEAVSRLSLCCHLLLIGSGPEKDALLTLAARLGIRERTVFLDQVPTSVVPKYLSCMDCLVLPSRTRPNWKEQFGRVLIEAMACEVPVLGSNSGEIPRVMGDGGLVFEEGAVSDLSEKLNRLLQNRDLGRSLGTNGRKRVLSLYTQRKIALDTLHVYNALMTHS